MGWIVVRVVAENHPAAMCDGSVPRWRRQRHVREFNCAPAALTVRLPSKSWRISTVAAHSMDRESGKARPAPGPAFSA